jgi:1,2-phenylacetyl-CoA epoxidase PaaB subunit
MEITARYNSKSGEYEVYIDGHYFHSYHCRSEEEALERARRDFEREQRLIEYWRWREERISSLPPLSEWTIDEIFDAYSPYAIHPYTTDELDAELARRFGITVEPGQDVLDVLLKLDLIDRKTWERLTDFWDDGVAY